VLRTCFAGPPVAFYREASGLDWCFGSVRPAFAAIVRTQARAFSHPDEDPKGAVKGGDMRPKPCYLLESGIPDSVFWPSAQSGEDLKCSLSLPSLAPESSRAW
jgi:hypothetical protein